MSTDAKTESTGGEENKIDLSPDKQIYKSAAVDVSPVDAIEELVDNALDNWMRTSQRVDDIEINIVAEEGYTSVTDDTGGLSRDRIAYLFALGKTFQHEIAGAIGAYGIGAKKAIVRLGDERTIKSHARGADQGYGFTVDQDWLDSDEWSVTIEEVDDLNEGETVLIMETDDRIWVPETLEQLRTQLGKTYKLFLEGSVPDAGHVDLKVNGTSIKPANDPDWSFTPFDGLHPRRYENIELYPKSIDSPVRMDVTVGLMREGSESSSGTSIYCQDRLVTEYEQREVGGYGKAGRNRIGNWTHHNNRLFVRVELSTTGDGSELPWDGQKSTIDPHHPVSRSMYHWLARIATPYFDAHKDEVKKAFVYPYHAEQEHAANGGEIEVLDYSNKQNVNDKPNADLDDAQRVMRLAEGYTELGFKCYDDIGEEFIPAFDRHFANHYDPDHHGGTSLDEVPVRENLDEDERIDLQDQEEQLTSLVNSVHGAGKSKKDALMQAGYVSLEHIAEASISEIARVDGVGRRLANRLNEAARKRLEKSAEGDSENHDDGGDTGPDSPSENVSDGTESDSKDNESVKTVEDSGSQKDDTVPDIDQRHDQLEFGEVAEDEIRVPLDLEREEYELLREALQIEDDDLNVFAEAVRERLLRIYSPMSA